MRQPIAAGSFYPADKTTLRQQIDGFLQQAPKIVASRPRIILVPHAGYSYSGLVAAYAYKQLTNHAYSRVILCGDSHQGRYQSAALYLEGGWQTPLGNVELDTKTVQSLLQSDLIHPDDGIHVMEHSLEVQLPFLQKLLDSFYIIPLLLGTKDASFARKLASEIVPILNEQTLIVISSDLSHYPSYETANQVDEKTVEAIVSLDVNQFEKTVQASMKANHFNLQTCACGQGSIKAGLYLAQELEVTATFLTYANSGDTGPSKNEVVGYTAIAFA